VESVRFLSSDVAIADGRYEVTGFQTARPAKCGQLWFSRVLRMAGASPPSATCFLRRSHPNSPSISAVALRLFAQAAFPGSISRWLQS
jgi:hypothetical protein